MKKESFFILVLMVAGIGMIIRTFFGGGTNEEISTNEGFIDQITTTGNTTASTTGNEASTRNETTVPIIEDTKTNNSGLIEITFAMPSHFYTAGRRNFAQDIYKQHNIYIKFQLIDNLENLHNLLTYEDFSGNNILLVPYDWASNISTRSVQFGQDISQAFDPFIYKLVKKNTIQFMPFSADPIITYHLSGYLNKGNFSEISELSYNWNPPKTKAFPIFFGITNDDVNNEGFYWEYQDIVRYALMHYFITYRDINSLRIRIDSNVFEQYNTNTLNEILTLLTNSIPYCNTYRSICFQIYNFVGFRFGFLSDADIVKQYFSQKYSSFLNIKKSKVPFFSLESPVRIRGFISPQTVSKEKANGINTFLIQYMNNYNNYSLWNSTLSIFKSEGYSLKDNEFIGERGYILNEGGNFIKEMSNKNIFRDLINYQITAQDYLKKV